MREPPNGFKRRLEGLSPRLSVVWSPALEAWCVFYRTSSGRTLKLLELFDAAGAAMELNDRAFERIAQVDLRTMDDPEHAKRVARREYNEFRYREEKKKASQRAETAYKARQFASLWAMAADKMLTQGRYSKKPMKHLIKRAMGKMTPTTGKLLRNLGLPNLTGKALTLKGGD